jgi:hypothetical protein
MKLEFFDKFYKNPKASYLMNTFPLWKEFFILDGGTHRQTERQTDRQRDANSRFS